MSIIYQNIGPLRLPAIAGHDKLTHSIYGAIAAGAAATVATLTGKDAAAAALFTGLGVAVLKEVLDYTVRRKPLTQENIRDTLIDFVVTALPGIVLAYWLAK